MTSVAEATGVGARGPSPAARTWLLAGAVAAGALVAERAPPSPAIAVGTAGVTLALAATTRRAWALFVAAVALGSCLAGLRIASLDRAALAEGARTGADALIEGELLSDARVDGGAARFVIGVARAQIDGVGYALRERATVTVRPAPDTDRLTVGARVRLDAALRPVLFADLDAEGRSFAMRLRRQGIAARAFASPDDLVLVGRSGSPVAAVVDVGRRAVRRAASHLPDRHRGLLLGITIGDVSLLDPEMDLDFRATGLTHLVAVSGANVAMVLAVIALGLRALRASRRVTVAAMGVAVCCFMAITRFEPSVLRAGTMAFIALAGLAAGARRRATAALAAATLILLVIDPFLVHAVGFQLSVLATLGILVVGPRIAERLPQGKLTAAAAVTLGAQVAVAPLLVLHFRQLSIISIAANLLVEPAVAPATIVGMLAAAAGAVWAPLSHLSIAALPFLAWMTWCARALAQLPLATVGTPAGVAGLAAAAAFAALAVALARGRRVRLMSLAIVITSVAATATWVRALDAAPPPGLSVTMLDVGQGDAILVRAGSRAMLVDGGPDEADLLRGLRAAGVHRIDLLVSTHPHEDHVAGLVAVAERYPIGRMLDPGIEDPLASYGRLLEAIEARAIARDRAVAGMTYALGPARVDVLWPPEEHLTGTPSDVNNNSVVLRVTYGADAVLLAGEVEEAGQQELLVEPDALRAAVVKVSHHGSARMLPEFYAATGARVAMIPVGPNTFGHPAPATLAALTGMRILRTDLSGTVTVGLDGSGGIGIHEERPAAA